MLTSPEIAFVTFMISFPLVCMVCFFYRYTYICHKKYESVEIYLRNDPEARGQAGTLLATPSVKRNKTKLGDMNLHACHRASCFMVNSSGM